jgi:hypothetical protein
MGRKALRRSAGKALSVDIYERGDRRYHVVWKDETGQRCFASRGSLAGAKRSRHKKSRNWSGTEKADLISMTGKCSARRAI